MENDPRQRAEEAMSAYSVRFDVSLEEFRRMARDLLVALDRVDALERENEAAADLGQQETEKP